MSKFKVLTLIVLGVVLVSGLLAYGPLAAATRSPVSVTVETREVSAGTVTETTETFAETDSPLPDLVGRSVVVETNIIELPEGIITERIEIIDPLPAAAGGGDAVGASVAGDYVQTGEIEVHSDAGPLTIPLYGPQAVAPESDTDARGRVSPLSWSIFTDDLYATCSAGVRFDYSSTTGTSYYTLRWGSGQTSNSKTCSGAQCNYTISTNWSAYYTYADAQILSPGLVWGASNAYRCN